MKKIKFSVTALVMLLTVGAFALEPVKVSPNVKNAFEKSFSTARDISWDKVEEYYFASFKLNGLNVDVAYNEAGDLVGTSRKISTRLLPLSVSLAIANIYAGYELDKLVTEMNYEGSTCYFVWLKNSSQLLKIKASADGDLSVQKKLKL